MLLPEPELRRYWSDLMWAMGIVKPKGTPPRAATEVFDRLIAEYSQANRFYHNLSHIAFVLFIIDQLTSDLNVEDTEAIFLAAWFHDVIYDSRAGDNEETSTRYAHKALRQLNAPGETIDEVSRLILATKSHRADRDDLNAQILLDADLAILGAHPDDYDDYARAIRKEYAWVSEDKYRAGRTQVLEGFLSRESIYFTGPMRDTHEAQARRNISRELYLLAEDGDAA
jgi:predicted metal-dependent HD superfamily phosphohydrolase